MRTTITKVSSRRGQTLLFRLHLTRHSLHLSGNSFHRKHSKNRFLLASFHYPQGSYNWPVTLAGVSAHLPCASGVPSPLATHFCSHGTWIRLNTSVCAFISPTTKVLQDYALANHSADHNHVLSSARMLHNFIGDGRLLQDPIDITFLSRSVENYLHFMARHRRRKKWRKELAHTLVDLIDAVLRSSPDLMARAEVQSRAAASFRNSLATLSELLVDSTLNRFGDKLAFEEVLVKPEPFPGLSCSSQAHGFQDRLVKFWKASTPEKHRVASDKVLYCRLGASETAQSASGPALSLADHHRMPQPGPQRDETLDAEAAIRLPATLFQEAAGAVPRSASYAVGPAASSHRAWAHTQAHHANNKQQATEKKPGTKLQLSLFRDGTLFPVNESSSAARNESLADFVLSSFVVGCRVAGMTIENLLEPVQVILHVDHFTQDIVPVFWDEQHNIWTKRDCYIVESDPRSGAVRFKCHQLGFYGLLQRRSTLRRLEESRRLSEPFLVLADPSFVGSLLSLPCLSIVLLFYTTCFSAIQMPSKTKHAFINTCICLMSLVIVSAVGLKQFPRPLLCQTTAIATHFFTTAIFLWMLSSIFILYRAVARQRALLLGGADDADFRREVAAFSSRQTRACTRAAVWSYVFSYGLAALASGVSAPFTSDVHFARDSCSPELEPRIAIIYAPVAGIVLVGLLFFLLTRCLLKGGLGTDTVSPGVIVSLTGIESAPLKSESCKSKNSEWRFRSQLRVQFAVFVLVVLMWTSLALATVVQPIRLFLVAAPIKDAMLFGAVYSTLACLLSFYLLTFYCLRRQEFRQILRRLITCQASSKSASAQEPRGNKLSRSAELSSNRSSRIILPSESAANCLPSATQKEVDNFVNNLNNAHEPTEHHYGVVGVPFPSSRVLHKSNSGGIDLILSGPHQSKPSVYPFGNEDVNNISFPQLLDETVKGPAEVFLNPRLNAIAKRFFEKSRTRQHARIVTDMNTYNNLNIDSKSDFGGPIKALFVPKLTNCNGVSKARSEIVTLSSPNEATRSVAFACKPNKSHRCPASPGTRVARTAREMNVYNSSPHVNEDTRSGHRSPSSHTSSPAKSRIRRELRSSVSIPAALQSSSASRSGLEARRVGRYEEEDRDRTESQSICCQSDVLSAVSQPWSNCSKRSSRLSSTRKAVSGVHQKSAAVSSEVRDAPQAHQQRSRRKVCECCGNGVERRTRPRRSSREKKKSTRPRDVDELKEGTPDGVELSAEAIRLLSPRTRRKRRRRLSTHQSAERNAEMMITVAETGGQRQTEALIDHVPKCRTFADQLQLPNKLLPKPPRVYCSSSE